jgi:mRNA interferase HicA
MKRRKLVAHLREHGCKLLGEGANHSIWQNPVTGRKEAIPRHPELKRQLARAICRNLSVDLPVGE